MITVKEAKQFITENCNTTRVELLSLREAYGCIAAEPIYSLIDTPPFNQSAMDGYAFLFDEKKSTLFLTGEIQTGNIFQKNLNPIEAVRIFTGAALPNGADTVVMQEKVIVSENKISITDDQLIRGSNVRLKGSQTKKGTVVLNSGSMFNPAVISFLAGVGIDKVKVFAKPAISIIVTGKELVQPGENLSEGKIYESNSFGLTAAINQLGITPISTQVVDDEEIEIRNVITNQLHNDIVLITGGISVGDYDFVSSALEKCGVKKIFHKVKQKPGKPFYFGKYNNTLVFALPGNPAAVLSCFYEYVVPVISSFTKKDYFRKIKLPLLNDFRKKTGLTFFMKGKTNGNGVKILNNQESYLMNSFAMADCIVELEEGAEIYNKGELVSVSMIE